MKLSVCVLVGSLIPSGLAVSWGLGNDKAEAPEVLAKAATSSQPKRLFADAGYDAEWVHEFCRKNWQVESVIKPAVHRADGGLNGQYRSQMTEAKLKEKNYGKRWLVESSMSGLKRTTGSALTSRNDQSLFVEAALRMLKQLPYQLFYRCMLLKAVHFNPLVQFSMRTDRRAFEPGRRCLGVGKAFVT